MHGMVQGIWIVCCRENRSDSIRDETLHEAICRLLLALIGYGLFLRSWGGKETLHTLTHWLCLPNLNGFTLLQHIHSLSDSYLDPFFFFLLSNSFPYLCLFRVTFFHTISPSFIHSPCSFPLFVIPFTHSANKAGFSLYSVCVSRSQDTEQVNSLFTGYSG